MCVSSRSWWRWRRAEGWTWLRAARQEDWPQECLPLLAIPPDNNVEPLTSVASVFVRRRCCWRENLTALRPVILRMANPQGERQPVEGAQGVVATLLNCALAGQPIEMGGMAA